VTERLNQENLSSLVGVAELPRYNRDKLKAGIVHLGVGAFHRAHQAWYTEQVLNREAGDGDAIWGIVGASLRSSGVRDQLAPQQGLYTIVEREGAKAKHQVVGAVKQVLVGPEDPQALVNQIADPAIKIVTLTITEKGYLYDSHSKGLLIDNPDIQADIQSFPDQPVTAIGYLAAAIRQRRISSAQGITLLSCDNLPHNGWILKKVLKDFLSRVDAGSLDWIERNATFPCSMVDRIVPASTETDLAELGDSLGVADQAAVFTEPFSQWVIEDKFACGAPDWESVGVLYTDDGAPFESMKLSLLNGCHSLIAYLGFQTGYNFVHEVMSDKCLGSLVRVYMDTQAEPTLELPDGFDIDNYKSQLCKRFANSALNHRTIQIAQDGSQKIPQRWFSSINLLEERGMSTDILALCVAGWIRFLRGERENGERYSIDDPLGEKLHACYAEALSESKVEAIARIFPPLETISTSFKERVIHYHAQIVEKGVRSVVSSVLN